jgi:hypothetical protein
MLYTTCYIHVIYPYIHVIYYILSVPGLSLPSASASLVHVIYYMLYIQHIIHPYIITHIHFIYIPGLSLPSASASLSGSGSMMVVVEAVEGYTTSDRESGFNRWV